CVDGLASYVGVFCSQFRKRHLTGKPGRPPSALAPGFLLGQVIKSRLKRRVVDVAHKAVCDTLEQIEQRLALLGAGQLINTAYVERFNATLRSRLFCLVRKGRAPGRTQA